MAAFAHSVLVPLGACISTVRLCSDLKAAAKSPPWGQLCADFHRNPHFSGSADLMATSRPPILMQNSSRVQGLGLHKGWGGLRLLGERLKPGTTWVFQTRRQENTTSTHEVCARRRPTTPDATKTHQAPNFTFTVKTTSYSQDSHSTHQRNLPSHPLRSQVFCLETGRAW